MRNAELLRQIENEARIEADYFDEDLDLDLVFADDEPTLDLYPEHDAYRRAA